MSKKRTAKAKVISELNQHLESLVPMIVVRRHLHKQSIHGRADIPKPLVTDLNAKRYLQWCHTHKTWSIGKCKKVTGSYERLSYFSLQQDGCMFHGGLKKAYEADCLLPIVKHGGGYVMIWAAIKWLPAGPIATLKRRIINSKYKNI
ncbi:DDE_3 domain-containing protein [Trichonephila clavipes]|nr:DDE_3 domain-containing protein [Trichonephila clavipes]